MEYLKTVLNSLFLYLQGVDPVVQAQIEGSESIEYLRLMTEFPPEEIVRLQLAFVSITGNKDKMNMEQFLSIESIERNPLKHRIAKVFKLNTPADTITSDEFVMGLAQFNSPGKRDDKLRLMFRLHDDDEDGLLTAEDVVEYLKIITDDSLPESEIFDAVATMFGEFDGSRRKGLSLADFNIVVGPTDFHTRLFIPI